MRVKQLIPAAVIALLAILYYQEIGRSQALRVEVLSLQKTLSEIQAAKQADRNSKSNETVVAKAIPDNSDQLNPAIANSESKNVSERSRRSKFLHFGGEIFASRQITDIDDEISLDDSEKLRLKDRLGDLYRDNESQSLSDQESQAKFKEALSDVIGEDRANLYMNIKHDREAKEEHDSIELASSTFTKHLNLSPEQDAQVAVILKQINGELGTSSKMLSKKIEAMHSQGDNTAQDPEQAMKQFRNLSNEIRTERRNALNTQLRSVLTKEQYNSLLSEQATSPNSIWGLRGY